ncbi:hypothetical protein GJ700_21850 [Duganella sp. FT92W]|uniref:Permease n=1 Tax=Pseudoduganella rivuli TaxID=2666085 RepID=A0A7X2LTA4_9BURK|nr:hypothetical protein [Pseudoduganella rivuli]MRV74355.1 hypothetical protein [Pseudoduganella rivuli]
MRNLRKVAWLLRLEMRLAIRSAAQYAGDTGLKLMAAGAGLLYLVLNGLFSLLLPPEALRLAANPDILVISAVLLAVMFSVLSANQIFQLVAMRRDTLLIFLSPFPASVVLFARILTAACKTALLPLFIITPILNQFIFRGQYELWGFIPATVALSILVSCMWTAVFSLSVRTIGVNSSKIVASFAGLFAALAFGMVTATRHTLHIGIPAISSSALPSGIVWLSSSIMGNPLPLLVLVLAACIALATISVTQHKMLLHVVFSQELTKKSSVVDSRFSSSFLWAILKKEWRLVLRDSDFWLHFVRITFVILIAAGFLYKTGYGMPVVAAAIVVACCIMANDISWLMVATEKASELIASSPRSFSEVLRAKVIAAGILPVAALLTICLGYGLNNLKLSLVSCVVGVPAVSTTVALNTVMAFRKKSLRIATGTAQPGPIVVAQAFSILCFGLAALLLSRLLYP